MRISDDDIRNYKIKTSSSMILDKVNKPAPKPKSKLIFRLGVSLSSLMALAAVILCIILFPNNNQPNNKKNTLNVNEETLNFQVSSLLTIISNETVLSYNSLTNYNKNRLNSSKNDDDTFNDIVKEYQLFEDVIYNKYYKLNEKITFNYNDYQGYYDNYQLMLGYNDYKIYINYINKEDDESEFKGEIEINGAYYKIEGKEEKETDELELTTKIYLSDDEYYLVEEEYENDEYSYRFLIKLKNKEKQEYKLEIEEDNITFMVKSNDKEYEYDIKVLDEKNWTFECNHGDGKLDFSLEIDKDGKKNYNKK